MYTMNFDDLYVSINNIVQGIEGKNFILAPENRLSTKAITKAINSKKSSDIALALEEAQAIVSTADYKDSGLVDKLNQMLELAKSNEVEANKPENKLSTEIGKKINEIEAINSLLTDENKIDVTDIKAAIESKDNDSLDKAIASVSNNLPNGYTRTTILQALMGIKEEMAKPQLTEEEIKTQESVSQELDSKLNERINIIDTLVKNGENLVNTDKAKKALETHNPDDIVKAIKSVENSKDNFIITPLFNILTDELKAYTGKTVEEYEADKALASANAQAVKESNKEFKGNQKELDQKLESLLDNNYVYDANMNNIADVKEARQFLKTHNVSDLVAAINAVEPNKDKLKPIYDTLQEMTSAYVGLDLSDRIRDINVPVSAINNTTVNQEPVQQDSQIKDINIPVNNISTVEPTIEPQPVVTQSIVQDSQIRDVRTPINAAQPVHMYGAKEPEPVAAPVDEFPAFTNELLIERLKSIKNEKLADSLFMISRGNTYNGTSPKEQPIVSGISQREAEYTNLINSRNNIDFEDEMAVSDWLDKLTPYLNTHALTLNPPSDAKVNKPVPYLLSIMEEHGYLPEVNTNDSPIKQTISSKLNELEEHGYIKSEYNNLPPEFAKLNNEKTIALAVALHYQKIINGIDEFLNEAKKEGNENKRILATSKDNGERCVTNLETLEKSKEKFQGIMSKLEADFKLDHVMKLAIKAMNEEPVTEQDKTVTPVEEKQLPAVVEEEELDLTITKSRGLDKFTPVQSFKRIGKHLYDQITSIEYKAILRKAKEKMLEAKASVVNIPESVMTRIRGSKKMEFDIERFQKEAEQELAEKEAKEEKINLDPTQDPGFTPVVEAANELKEASTPVDDVPTKEEETKEYEDGLLAEADRIMEQDKKEEKSDLGLIDIRVPISALNQATPEPATDNFEDEVNLNSEASEKLASQIVSTIKEINGITDVRVPISAGNQAAPEAGNPEVKDSGITDVRVPINVLKQATPEPEVQAEIQQLAETVNQESNATPELTIGSDGKLPGWDKIEKSDAPVSGVEEVEKSIANEYVSPTTEAKKQIENTGIKDIRVPARYAKQNIVQARPDEIEMHKILQEEAARSIVNSMTQSNEQAVVQGRGI